MIKKIKQIPKELDIYADSDLTKDLPSDAFADNVNRLFLINDEDSIMESFAFLADNPNIPYIDYSKAEQLIILDRVCRAAEKYELDLESYVESLESLGGDTMLDLNDPEVKKVIEAEVTSRVKVEASKIMADFSSKSETAKALTEAQKAAEDSKAALVDAQKDNDVLKAEKQKIEQDFESYKKEIESKAKLRTRVDELKQVGLAKDEEGWKKIEGAIADMSDNAFAAYKESVVEYVKALQYSSEEEKKKKLEEDKKKKDKEKKATASDIVKESKENGTPLNGDDSDPEDRFPNLTKAFDRIRGGK